MALAGPTLLTADPDTSNASSYATPSVSPTAGALILVGVRNTDGSDAIQPTLSSAFSVVGGTWTLEASAQNSTSVERVTLFSAVATGSPGSGAITADFGGDAQTGCLIEAVEYTGQDATDAVLQQLAFGHSGAGVTSRTATLAGALGSVNNQVLAFISHNVNEDQTAGGGGTELASSDVGYDTPACRQGVYYEVGDNSVSASWATSSRGSWVACEIVAASGATTHQGSSSLTATVARTTTGTLTARAASTLTAAAALTTAATRTTFGSSTLTAAVAATTAGTLTARSSSTLPVVVTITSNGDVTGGGPTTHQGSSSLTLTVASTTAGTRTTFGSSAFTGTVSTTTTGTLTAFSASTLPVVVTITSSGSIPGAVVAASLTVVDVTAGAAAAVTDTSGAAVAFADIASGAAVAVTDTTP